MEALWYMAGLIGIIVFQIKLGYWQRFYKDLLDTFTVVGGNLVINKEVAMQMLFKHLSLFVLLSLILSPLIFFGLIGLGIAVYVPRARLPQFF